MTTPKKRPPNQVVLALMYAGAALTAFAALFPFIDRATATVLADHIRAGYPAYEPGAIDAAVTAYLILLSVVGALGLRSEEHTSELQSRENLVCRLLLEKKKHKKN